MILFGFVIGAATVCAFFYFWDIVEKGVNDNNRDEYIKRLTLFIFWGFIAGTALILPVI